MTVPKINSAHGSDTRNIINRAIEILNQQGKTIQDLVAEGQLTDEQYAELITVINSHLKSGEVDKFDLSASLQEELNKIDDKINKGDVNVGDIAGELKSLIDTIPKKIESGNVVLDDLSPEILGAISGDASFDILSIPRDKSVTPEKTTFIQVVSNNLYDEEYTPDKSIDTNTGEIIDNSTNYGVSNMIPVEENTTYTKKDTSGTGVGYYREDGSFISWERENQTFTTPPETARLILVIHAYNRTNYRLNKGDTLLDYDKYRVKIKNQNIDIDDLSPELANKIDEGAAHIMNEIVLGDNLEVGAEENHFLNTIGLWDAEFVNLSIVSDSAHPFVLRVIYRDSSNSLVYPITTLAGSDGGAYLLTDVHRPVSYRATYIIRNMDTEAHNYKVILNKQGNGVMEVDE